MHPAVSRVTLSDDKDKTPLTKEELFEALDEYTSALEKCKELEEGSQRAAKERREAPSSLEDEELTWADQDENA